MSKSAKRCSSDTWLETSACVLAELPMWLGLGSCDIELKRAASAADADTVAADAADAGSYEMESADAGCVVLDIADVDAVAASAADARRIVVDTDDALSVALLYVWR
ncbi:uncharacterized protein UMAG_03389 [Mycosarcoma maydis]|uniref:Uncharacterized protein n=1 Tax=Mycosarcoma maydis TaxID=5270 RepID=A0A0D1CQC4_MYCMD|nr:uncharacterized protein UMAG_03389 [Ustilago maydis 521]KIS68823.1 hypothetical protein UMAG_03389 [Ustilago maydis 521]|eukprot:XP_011389767.1 hypothetical protein UMAG_03389 [Ustilago maydis 521]